MHNPDEYVAPRKLGKTAKQDKLDPKVVEELLKPLTEKEKEKGKK